MSSLDILTLRRACPLALADFFALAPVVPPSEGLSAAAGALAARGALRACGLCREHVVDLSALPRAEAEALAAGPDRPGCMAIVRDRLGQSVHRPAQGVGAAAGLALLFAGYGCERATSSVAAAPAGHRVAYHVPGVKQTLNAADAAQRQQDEELGLLLTLGGYVDDGPAPPTGDVGPAGAANEPGGADAGGGFRRF